MIESVRAPAISKTALTICIQVVAIIPPSTMYTVINTPMMSTESQYGQAEQQTDERPGPDELRDHVEHADKDGVERRRRPNAARVEAGREHVRQRVLAQVPQRLGHEQEHDQVGDQKAYREVESREARKGNGP